MKKGILIQVILTIAVITAVMVIYIISTGKPVITRLEPGQTIDNSGNIVSDAAADNQSDNDIPETTYEDFVPETPEIAPDIAPEGFHNKESEQQQALSNAESAFLSLAEYIRAYNRILLPPVIFPPRAPFPQANQHEMDRIDTDKIFTMGYLPADPFSGTLEKGNICENLRTYKSNMTIRLCAGDDCENDSSATKEINNAALIIFPGDSSFTSKISYSPELPEGYFAANFIVTIRNIDITKGIDEENYSLYGDLLIATTTQLTKALCE